MTRVIQPATSRILSWMATASIDELLNLAPPSEVIPIDPNREFPDFELQEQYAWAIDHFSSTFYSEWSTSSLHYAFRWLSGQEVAPCDADLMSDRRIDRAQLNAEIARRAAAQRHRRPAKPRIDNLLANEMNRYAASLLDAKRYREAAAIFKFASDQKPYDGNFRNNLGFCLIPEDPLEALGHLRAAAEMNYHRPAVNVYNQMCCHIALRRPREALAVAETMWTDLVTTSPASATLWRRGNSPDDWAIFRTEDDRLCVAELAVALSQEEGWPDAERIWRERQQRLDSPNELL